MKTGATILKKYIICYNSIIDATAYKYYYLDYQPDMKTINYLIPDNLYEFYNLYLEYPVFITDNNSLSNTYVEKISMDFFIDWLKEMLSELIHRNLLSHDCMQQYAEYINIDETVACSYIANECISIYEKRIDKLFSDKNMHSALEILDDMHGFLDMVDSLPDKTPQEDEPVVMAICAASVCIQIAVEIFFLSKKPEK
ncbi:MAG: hypothetical protein K6A23_08940 [Butyrivibrio sp.]|nr:hypothetical protein [Butyrivibrio sp.]